MFEIKVKNSFSAAHNLADYKGKCERLHGHNWTVETVFAYPEVAKDGMAIDFHDAKKLVASVIEQFDHSYLNESDVLRQANPTSENIARFIFGAVRARNANVKSVSVWENEGSCATYYEK